MICSELARAGVVRRIVPLAAWLAATAFATGCHPSARSGALVVVSPAVAQNLGGTPDERIRLQSAPNPAGRPWSVDYVNATEIVMLDTLGILQQVSLATERPWWRKIDTNVCAAAVHRPTGTLATARYAQDRLLIRTSTASNGSIDLALPLTEEESSRSPLLVGSFNADASRLVLSESLRDEHETGRRLQAWLIDLESRQITRLDVVDAHFISGDAYLCRNPVEQGVWVVQASGPANPSPLPAAVTGCVFADAASGRAIVSLAKADRSAETGVELCIARWQGGHVRLDRPFDSIPSAMAACLAR